jgi:hypothetical protein
MGACGAEPVESYTDEALVILYQEISGRSALYGQEPQIQWMFELRKELLRRLARPAPAATPDSVFSPLPVATGPYVKSPVKTPVNKLNVTPAAPGEVYAIANTTIGASLPPASDVIRFMTNNAGMEIMRLDFTGMTYMGKRIEDAGEAHRAFIATMHAMQQAPACHKNNAVFATEKDAVAQARVTNAAKILAAIADAYDANNLDEEARKFSGENLDRENPRQPRHIELYSGRGGKQLLTLQDCLDARDALHAMQAGRTQP